MELKKNDVVELKINTPLIGGQEFVVEGKCSEVFNDKNWVNKYSNPAIWQFLNTHSHINSEDCYYGKVGYLGYIITIDEVEE